MASGTAVLLASHRRWADLALLDPVTGALRVRPRSGYAAPAPTRGFYDHAADGAVLALYDEAGRVWLQHGADRLPVRPDTRAVVDVGRGLDRELRVGSWRVPYRAEDRLVPADLDPTPVDDADFDVGLRITAVLADPVAQALLVRERADVVDPGH